MKKIICIITGLLFVFNIPALAQTDSNQVIETTVTAADTTKKVWIDPYPSWEKKWSIGISAGLPGLSLEAAKNLNRRFNLRFIVDGMKIEDYSTTMDVGGQMVDIVANFDLIGFESLIEYHPFNRGSFKIVSGLSYFPTLSTNVNIMMAEGSSYGDLEISREEIGEINVDCDFSGIAPYIGAGFGRAVPKRRMGLSLDFGAFYVGPANVTVTATEMLENTEQEEEQLEENLSSYSWIPRYSLRLTYKL